jgi:undecaprenyl pyrophosphate phosphatase UppP
MRDRNGESRNPYERRLIYLYAIFGAIALAVLPSLFLGPVTRHQFNFWFVTFWVIVIGIGLIVQEIKKKKNPTSAND